MCVDDYIPGPYYVTIPAGNITKSFNISLRDDDIFEGKEEFSVFISSDIVIGIDKTEATIGIDKTEVTIIDTTGT